MREQEMIQRNVFNLIMQMQNVYHGNDLYDKICVLAILFFHATAIEVSRVFLGYLMRCILLQGERQCFSSFGPTLSYSKSQLVGPFFADEDVFSHHYWNMQHFSAEGADWVFQNKEGNEVLKKVNHLYEWLSACKGHQLNCPCERHFVKNMGLKKFMAKRRIAIDLYRKTAISCYPYLFERDERKWSSSSKYARFSRC